MIGTHNIHSSTATRWVVVYDRPKNFQNIYKTSIQHVFTNCLFLHPKKSIRRQRFLPPTTHHIYSIDSSSFATYVVIFGQGIGRWSMILKKCVSNGANNELLKMCTWFHLRRWTLNNGFGLFFSVFLFFKRHVWWCIFLCGIDLIGVFWLGNSRLRYSKSYDGIDGIFVQSALNWVFRERQQPNRDMIGSKSFREGEEKKRNTWTT